MKKQDNKEPLHTPHRLHFQPAGLSNPLGMGIPSAHPLAAKDGQQDEQHANSRLLGASILAGALSNMRAPSNREGRQ